MSGFLRRVLQLPKQTRAPIVNIDVEDTLRQALACHQRGELVDAQARYEQVLASQPANFDALHLLGVVHYQKGDYRAAVESIQHAVVVDDSRAAAHSNLGLALHSLGKFDEALASYDKSLALQPDYADALQNRGNTLRRLKRSDEALQCYDRALALNPHDVVALTHRGNALFELKRPDEALQSYDRALALKPNDPLVLNNRANALLELQKPLEALADYDRALALKPDYADALLNRGNALRALLQPEDALASYDRAFALRPDHVEALVNRANALQDLQRYDDALATYEHALAIDADLSSAHHNEALCRLLMGDFASGWRKYEWRWRDMQLEPFKRTFGQPLWLGKAPLAGKTILLHAEQGLGDTIQFARYATYAAKRGANVVMEVPPALLSLLTRLEGVSHLVGCGEPLPPFDYHCPLLSLPLAFDTRLDSVPAAVPYLCNEPERVAAWRLRLGDDGRPRVGLVWSGSVTHKNDRNRSIPLQALLPLLEAKAQFVSLQKDVRPADQAVLRERGDIQHIGEQLEDFADTAAVIGSIDLLITVDTAVAHLAGALGKPVWILLPLTPDWRWLLDRDDSPWYPTARLLRQRKIGEWAPVIERAARDLHAFVDR